MTDKVIKNPKRDLYKRAPYEPEHVRLGINVPKAPGTDSYDDNLFGLDGDSLDENGEKVLINDGHIIDNNDYVNYGFNHNDMKNVPEPSPDPILSKHNTEPQVNDYMLMISGKLITFGPLSIIENKIRKIVYGEDPSFSNKVDIEDIVVLKRVAIKVGVFIDD